MLRLQQPVQRFESIRVKLAKLAWNLDIGTFFYNDVPFSFPSGPEYAARIGDLLEIISKQKRNPRTQLKILELGARLGMLSRNLMLSLQQLHPELYARIHAYISDVSEESLNHLHEIGAFDGIQRRTTLAPCEIQNLDLSEFPKLDLVFFSYLLDSIDQVQIEVKSGKIYELLTETYLADDTLVVDSTGRIPKVLKADDIKALFEQGEWRRIQILSDQIRPYLAEKYSKIPIEESAISESDKKILADFIADLKPKQVIRFNFNGALPQMLETIWEQLTDEGIILINDFGVTSSTVTSGVQHLCSEYGNTSFYSVYYPFISHIAKKLGATVHIHPQPDNDTQTMVLAKPDAPRVLEKSFKDCFAKLNGQRSIDYINALKELPKTASSRFQIDELLADLGPLASQEYLVLLNTAAHFSVAGDYKSALATIKEIEDRYPGMALSAYVLKAKILLHKKKYILAEKTLLRAIDISPEFPDTYHHLMKVYIHQKRYSDAYKAAQTFVRLSGQKNIWEHLFMVVLLALKAERFNDAIYLIDNLKELITAHPDLPPSDTLEKLAQLESMLANVPA